MFSLYYFLNMIIGPEFVFCRIHELPEQKEIIRGFADDLLVKSKIKISKYDVISFYIINDDLFINVKEKETLK